MTRLAHVSVMILFAAVPSVELLWSASISVTVEALCSRRIRPPMPTAIPRKTVAAVPMNHTEELMLIATSACEPVGVA
jgi:hypothetical protein